MPQEADFLGTQEDSKRVSAAESLIWVASRRELQVFDEIMLGGETYGWV